MDGNVSKLRIVERLRLLPFRQRRRRRRRCRRRRGCQLSRTDIANGAVKKSINIIVVAARGTSLVIVVVVVRCRHLTIRHFFVVVSRL